MIMFAASSLPLVASPALTLILATILLVICYVVHKDKDRSTRENSKHTNDPPILVKSSPLPLVKNAEFDCSNNLEKYQIDSSSVSEKNQREVSEQGAKQNTEEQNINRDLSDILNSVYYCDPSKSERIKRDRRKRNKKADNCSSKGTCNSRPKMESLVIHSAQEEAVQAVSQELSTELKARGMPCSLASIENLVVLWKKQLSKSELHLLLLKEGGSCTQVIETLSQRIEEDEISWDHLTYCFCIVEPSEETQVLQMLEELDSKLTSRGAFQFLPTQLIQHSHPEPGMFVENTKHLFEPKHLDIVEQVVQKSHRKCCGRTCGKKMDVDIEDIALLLPTSAPLTV